MKSYGFVCANGVNIIEGNNSACVFLNKNGKPKICTQKIKHNLFAKLPLLRGIYFLIFSLYVFFDNLMKNTQTTPNKLSQKSSNNLNLTANTIFICLAILFSFVFSYFSFNIIPIYLIKIMKNNNFNIFLIKFLLLFYKLFIIIFPLIITHLLNSFRQLYRLNGAINYYLINNYKNPIKFKNKYLKNSKIQSKSKAEHEQKVSYLYPFNFFNIILCGIIFTTIIKSIIGLSLQTWYAFLYNFVISLLCFALAYEMLYYITKSQNKFLNLILKPVLILTSLKPSITEIYLVQMATKELELMKINKRTITNNMQSEDKICMSTALLDAKKILEEKNKFEDSDVQFALCEVLNKSKVQVKMTNYLTIEQYKTFISAIKKRADGMPMTKIFGKAYFYGNEFIVTNDVLSPRQDTEILVEETLKRTKNKSRVLDLCTGSGAIAISVALNTSASVFATDISEKALLVAKQNASKLNANVSFIQSDLFSGLKHQRFDIIVSNPPYIKTDDISQLDEEVKNFDPKLALDGGYSGLDFYQKIIEQAPLHLTKKGTILFEVGINQAQDVKNLLQKSFENIIIVKDYNKIERVVIATLK